MQEDINVAYKDIKIFCYTNKFPLLQFSVPHTKLHVVRSLSKYYYMVLYPKLGHGICAIYRIICASAECTSTLEIS